MFDLFDSNGGGTIDAEELDLAMRSVEIYLSQEDLLEVLSAMDKDGNKEKITKKHNKNGQDIDEETERTTFDPRLVICKINITNFTDSLSTSSMFSVHAKANPEISLDLF